MFTRLDEHAARLAEVPLARLLAEDPARAGDFALRVGPLYANFARQRYDREALGALFEFARDADFPDALRRLADGEAVNPSEGRAALHTALRGEASATAEATAAHAMANEALQRMQQLVQAIHDDPSIHDVVSVGIGGSDLGPRLVVDALRIAKPRLCVHFVSNVDATAITRCLDQLDPAHTAGIVISKSFGTRETLLNGAILRDWLGDDARLHAVTARVDAAESFGIAKQRILPMWDWVGGRYSLWSTVGFPIALALGMPAFRQLLAGAAAFDRHVLSAEPEHNLACWHALTALWNRNGLQAASQAVLPYDQRLALLPAYLQQLVMESLGKRVQADGRPVQRDTAPVWWGGAGSDCQHSYFQALHQGTQVVPAEFIGVLRPDHAHAGNHAELLASLLAQAEALANGEDNDDPHRAYPGGRPSSLILLDALSPQALGHLLAMYEHSVYLQAVAWGINAFDQFGVELGKRLAERLLPALRGEVQAEDAVTRELLRQLR
ncbi:glucose-6-phosphate isomerase [Luteimonas sp. e5]